MYRRIQVLTGSFRNFASSVEKRWKTMTTAHRQTVKEAKQTLKLTYNDTKPGNNVIFIALFKLSCDFEWLKSAETNMNVQIWWVVIICRISKISLKQHPRKHQQYPFRWVKPRASYLPWAQAKVTKSSLFLLLSTRITTTQRTVQILSTSYNFHFNISGVFVTISSS